MKRKLKKLAQASFGGFLRGNVEYDRFKFEQRKGKRLKKAYYAYIITSGTAVILCICLLLFGSVGSFPSLFGGALMAVTRFIVNNSFMDLTVELGDESVSVGHVFDITEGILFPNKDELKEPSDTDDDKNENNDRDIVSKDTLYDFDYTAVPSGYTPIIPMNLSLSSYGSLYIHNSTGLTPDVNKLLSSKFQENMPLEYLSSASAPRVLIIHTHGTEAYSPNGAIAYEDNGEDIARSTDKEKNVVAVGKALQNALEKKGIRSIHCEIMHDEENYRDAYAAAEETIRLYLERYPTIKLVIDVHRDGIVKSSGELVRPVTVVDGKAAAQVMCVVGSSWGGEANDKWEKNLALALKLRQELNASDADMCRPVYLKSHTYNQEIAPYSLLIEIGSSGNSLEEALVAAEQIASALNTLMKQI